MNPLHALWLELRYGTPRQRLRTIRATLASLAWGAAALAVRVVWHMVLGAALGLSAGMTVLYLLQPAPVTIDRPTCPRFGAQTTGDS